MRQNGQIKEGFIYLKFKNLPKFSFFSTKRWLSNTWELTILIILNIYILYINISRCIHVFSLKEHNYKRYPITFNQGIRNLHSYSYTIYFYQFISIPCIVLSSFRPSMMYFGCITRPQANVPLFPFSHFLFHESGRYLFKGMLFLKGLCFLCRGENRLP